MALKGKLTSSGIQTVDVRFRTSGPGGYSTYELGDESELIGLLEYWDKWAVNDENWQLRQRLQRSR